MRIESGSWRPSCLNPLESGQSFEYNELVKAMTPWIKSQSPRIGAIIRMRIETKRVEVKAPCLNPLESGQSFELEGQWSACYESDLVSIPSNRGNHSNYFDTVGVPTGGYVSIPSNRGNHSNSRTGAYTRRNLRSLNPLESGQSFE